MSVPGRYGFSELGLRTFPATLEGSPVPFLIPILCFPVTGGPGTTVLETLLVLVKRTPKNWALGGL